MNNNVWNDKDQVGVQTMRVYGPDCWEVDADHNYAAAGREGAIKSYPCTQRNFTNRTAGSFAGETARFDMTSPKDGERNNAFDIWTGKWGGITGEIMIWTDHLYNGPLPPKNATESTTVTIDGQGYIAWRRPLNKDDKRWYIALAMTPMKAAGEINVGNIFAWLIGKGWLKETELIAAIEFGVEIAHGAGQKRTHRLNNFELSAH